MKDTAYHETIEGAAAHWNDDAEDFTGLVFLEDVGLWTSQDDAHQCETCQQSFSAQGNETCNCQADIDYDHDQEMIFGSFEQQVAADWHASR